MTLSTLPPRTSVLRLRGRRPTGRRPPGRRAAAAGLALGIGLVPLGLVPGTPGAPALAEPTPTTSGQPNGQPSGQPSGNPTQQGRQGAQQQQQQAKPGSAPPPAQTDPQAALVDQEDQRILQIRSVLTAILQIGGQQTAKWKQPQIFGSSHGKTLVLPNIGKAYTIADLAEYGGKYFKRLPDGSYLLGIPVFVADGAKLSLKNPNGPLVLRMGSMPGAFASIVSYGGVLDVEGTEQNPVQITSWNPKSNTPDTEVTDGRAYIRAVGGEMHTKHAKFSHLGFWSGRTGGIALTGTDRPQNEYKRKTKDERHKAKEERQEANKNRGGGGGPGDIEVIDPGGTATHVPAADLVTGSIDNTTITGNAFGLFVSGSNRSQITNNRIDKSLFDGLVMHRFAKNANISNTTVTGSGGDGIVLARATEKIQVSNCTSVRNGDNGFTVNGQALADGPSPSGQSLETYGGSTISKSVAENNGHYGIELLGGHKLSVQSSKIIGGDMGIVVRDAATEVQISGNELTGQIRQGVSVRDGVDDISLAGNTIVGARTGIYLRDSSGTMTGNVVKKATAHGITFVGDADGSDVRNNTLEGRGTSAISTSRSGGDVDKDDNNTDGWTDTASLWMKIRRYLTPMNLIWAGVFLMVLLSMLRARNGGLRIGRGGVHPYELQQALGNKPVWSLPRASAGRGPGQPAGAPPRAPAGAAAGAAPEAAPAAGRPVAGRHAAEPPGPAPQPQPIPTAAGRRSGTGPLRHLGPSSPQPSGPRAQPAPAGGRRGPQHAAPNRTGTTGPLPVAPPATPPHPTPRSGVSQPERR